jgi:sulfur relay (sulfurtransferase) DsrC/TusE family protein
MKLGFEFGDEKVVDEYVLNLFPRGPSMTANGRRVFRD